MHEIEPFHNWRHLYLSEEDEHSPLYGAEYSEFEYTNTIYNYYIHPQWDEFGSRTLYLKILFCDYEYGFAIIEFIGEWNDAIENDIMQLKRNIIDVLIRQGINKYILICENVLNCHTSDDSYYEEWSEDIRENGGWIGIIGMAEHNQQEFNSIHLERFAHWIDYVNWRNHSPSHLFQAIDNQIIRYLAS
jgi:hypothetical protein